MRERTESTPEAYAIDRAMISNVTGAHAGRKRRPTEAPVTVPRMPLQASAAVRGEPVTPY